jgi:hypothetical protein
MTDSKIATIRGCKRLNLACITVLLLALASLRSNYRYRAARLQLTYSYQADNFRRMLPSTSILTPPTWRLL